jgi:hypothetical protein
MNLRLRAVIAATLVLGLSSCALFGPSKPVATPADFERLGTRHYADRNHDEVSAASVTALKILGYTIVTTDPRIRTAPKDVATTANGSYSETAGTAQTFTEAVAWDIDVQPEGEGTVLRATPRATVNGEPMTQVYKEWAESNFGTLMKEIDSNLPAKK